MSKVAFWIYGSSIISSILEGSLKTTAYLLEPPVYDDEFKKKSPDKNEYLDTLVMHDHFTAANKRNLNQTRFGLDL